MLDYARKNCRWKDYLIMRTLACTGMRVSELSYITVEALSKGKAQVYSKNKFREIYLPDKLVVELSDYCQSNGLTEGPIFLGSLGTGIDRRSVWEMIQKTAQHCGIEKGKAHPHSFRHLFAKIFMGQYANLAELADILGHSSIETTRRYTMSFTKIHIRVEHLFSHEQFYQQYHECFFRQCAQDNIKYIEMRAGFQEFEYLENAETVEKSIVFSREDFEIDNYFYHRDMMTSPTPEAPNVRFLDQIRIALNNVNKEMGEGEDKLVVKVILTANRNKTDGPERTETCKKIDTAIAIKNCIGGVDKAFSYMVVGFDLVNTEVSGKGLTETLHDILYEKFGNYNFADDDKNKLSFLQEKNRIQLIRFFLHDGESIEHICNVNDNAITGPICSRHRIGHGFKMGTYDNLYEEGALGKYIANYILYGNTMDINLQYGNKDLENYPIASSHDYPPYSRIDSIPEPVIELCPISNYMLGYVDDLSQHPAIPLMEMGIFAAICNDDPLIFNNVGLTYDYVMMYIGMKKHFESRGISNAGDIAYRYLKISSFLGYFYQEMSDGYYYQINNNIVEVNDSMKPSQEKNDIFKQALNKFKAAWKKYIQTI